MVYGWVINDLRIRFDFLANTALKAIKLFDRVISTFEVVDDQMTPLLMMSCLSLCEKTEEKKKVFSCQETDENGKIWEVKVAKYQLDFEMCRDLCYNQF